MGIVRKFILTICIIVFVVSAGVLVHYYWNGAKEQNALKSLGEMKSDREDMVTDQGTIIGKYVDLYLANNDIIGWVSIEDTKIDYPVMQTRQDNEYYLKRGFDKSKTSSGTPFMDAASDIFIPTDNFLIYGHHMNNGTMFHDLVKYDDYEFYQEHDIIKFDTIYKGGQGMYQVLAAGYSQVYPEGSSEFQYYQYAGITTEAQFYEYLNGVKAISAYETGVSAEYGDQLITLSTCAYHVDNGRFFVVAKRIDAKKMKPQ